MDFSNIHTIQNLGIAIIHSIWQIGLMTFIYFYFILIRKKLSVHLKYTTGLICFVVVLISFILTFQLRLINNQSSHEILTSSQNVLNDTSKELIVPDWQQGNASKSGDYSDFFFINLHKLGVLLYQSAGAIGIIWILGLILLVFIKIVAYYHLKSIKRNKYNVRSIKWENTLKEISASLNLHKHVDILFSPFVNSPLSFGFLKPVILFPLRLITGLSNEEIKCILIHELAHNLRNDYLFNIFQNAIEVLFFYHPGIWWMSKQIRIQREIICDKIVLDNKISEKQYAYTLIKLGELQLSDSNLAIAAKRSNSELFTRIRHIINASDINKKKKNGNPLLALLVLMILVVSGFIYHGKETMINTNSLSNKTVKNLSSLNGSFAFYDINNDIYYESNDSLCNTRYPVYSTFKIASALIALDMGIAKNEFYTIPYDSLKYPLPGWMKENNFFKHWYKDHTIKTALEYSVNWYFKELGERIGNKNMIEYLNKLDYGNKNITPGNDAFWYNGQLKISAIEQVVFIKNIFNQNCKGISKDAQRIAKQLFPGEVENNYSLYGKTGTGEVADNRFIGWYVGYLETKENKYAYALNIITDDANKIPGDMRHEMVKNIFTDLGLLEK